MTLIRRSSFGFTSRVFGVFFARMTLLAALPTLEFTWIYQTEAWIALLTLGVLEIVLGIDNIVFISILVDKLPPSQQSKGRTLGLGLAMLTRIALLFSITWVMGLKESLFTFQGFDISGKDIILITGGLFLLFKSTHEIHEKLEGEHEELSGGKAGAKAAFGAVLVQIALLDIVFSLDSVITAVGMAQSITVMIIAVILAVIFMMIFSGGVAAFINDHPTVKMLALSFLILIGTALIAEGLHFHIPKGYVYFAMGFSVIVEMLNIRARKKRHLKADRQAE